MSSLTSLLGDVGCAPRFQAGGCACPHVTAAARPCVPAAGTSQRDEGECTQTAPGVFVL